MSDLLAITAAPGATAQRPLARPEPANPATPEPRLKGISTRDRVVLSQGRADNGLMPSPTQLTRMSPASLPEESAHATAGTWNARNPELRHPLLPPVRAEDKIREITFGTEAPRAPAAKAKLDDLWARYIKDAPPGGPKAERVVTSRPEDKIREIIFGNEPQRAQAAKVNPNELWTRYIKDESPVGPQADQEAIRLARQRAERFRVVTGPEDKIREITFGAEAQRTPAAKANPNELWDRYIKDEPAAVKSSTAARAGAAVGLVTGPLATVAGAVTAVQGVQELASAHTGKAVASGTLQTVSGAAGTTSGVATTMASVRVLTGVATGAAATVGAVAGGVAAAADGLRDIANSNGDSYKRNVGIAKTGGGTAMAVGAGMCATGVLAPVGAALMVGGGVVTAGSYLANTEVGHTVTGAVSNGVHAAVDWARHLW